MDTLALEASLLTQFRIQNPQYQELSVALLNESTPKSDLGSEIAILASLVTELADFEARFLIKPIPYQITAYAYLNRVSGLNPFLFWNQWFRKLGSLAVDSLAKVREPVLLIFPRNQRELFKRFNEYATKLEQFRTWFLAAQGEFTLSFKISCMDQPELATLSFETNYGNRFYELLTSDPALITVLITVVNELNSRLTQPLFTYQSIDSFHRALESVKYDCSANYTQEWLTLEPLSESVSTMERFYLNLFQNHSDLTIIAANGDNYQFNHCLLSGFFKFFQTYRLSPDESNQLRTNWSSPALRLLYELIYAESVSEPNRIIWTDDALLIECFSMLNFYQCVREELLDKLFRVVLIWFTPGMGPSQRTLITISRLPLFKSMPRAKAIFTRIRGLLAYLND